MRRRIFLLAGGAALGTVLLAGLLVKSIGSMLAYPFTYLAWMVAELYAYTPSWALWGVLLLAILLLGANSLIRPYNPAPEKDERATHHLHRRVTLLLSWLKQRNRPFYRQEINHEITELTARVLAQRNRTTPQEIRSALRRQELDIPPDLTYYLQNGLKMWDDASLETPRWWDRFKKRRAPNTEKDDALIEQALLFLESQLEVNNDPGYFNRSET